MTKPHDYALVSLPAHVGRDFGLSRAMRVAQSRIDQFAECSGDDQGSTLTWSAPATARSATRSRTDCCCCR